jgi:hypothetical protein
MSLHDLDELVLNCWNEEAKSYIGEAVACYKVGAYRASISSTWMAIVFDYIAKLKILSISGDKEAILQITKFEKAVNENDIKASLVFERELLEAAEDKLYLISTSEYIDLNRIYDDRCRCVHPAMNADNEIFCPTAELARNHIYNAVTYFLSLPPVQGKAALSSVLNTINSQYFPRNPRKALIALEATPLKRARPNFVNSVIVVLIKELLEKDFTLPESTQKRAALKAVEQMYTEIYKQALKKYLSKLIRETIDSNIVNAVLITIFLHDIEQYIELDVCQRLENVVEELPEILMPYFGILYSSSLFVKATTKRASTLTRGEIMGLDFCLEEVPPPLLDRIVQLYLASANYAEAKQFKTTIITYAEDFSKVQLMQLIDGCALNGQIWDSTGFDKVMLALRKNPNIDHTELDDMITSKSTLIKFIEEEE